MTGSIIQQAGVGRAHEKSGDQDRTPQMQRQGETV